MVSFKPKETFERIATLAAGIAWVACVGGQPDALLPALVGAAGLLGIVANEFAKTGPESKRNLDGIRNAIQQEMQTKFGEQDYFGVEAADQALNEYLSECFLKRDALVEAASDPGGFPVKATAMVMEMLASRRPDCFGPGAPAAGIDYAKTVVSTALLAAIEDRDYFEKLEARLAFSQSRDIARILEQNGRIETKIDKISDDTTALRDDTAAMRAMLEQLVKQDGFRKAEAAGLTEVQVKALLKEFAAGDLPVEQAFPYLLKAAAILREQSERLSRFTNDEPAFADNIQAAKEAIDAGEYAKADRILQTLEEDDIAQGQRRLLRAADTIAQRATLARAQSKFLDAASLFGRAAAIAAPLETEEALRWYEAQADALAEHGALFAGLTSFQQAIEILQQSCLPLPPEHSRPADWAGIQNRMGSALTSLGERLGGEAGGKKLVEAVAAYEAALGVYTEADMPADWAMTQNNLAIALTVLGDRLGGEAGAKSLEAAVTAFKAAQRVYTEVDVPADWALTQSNLAHTLASLGERLDGEAGAKRQAEAVTACKAALRVYTEADMPTGWAKAQNTLGRALTSLAERFDGEAGVEKLLEAVTACEAALRVYSESDMPADWARAQTDLGNALAGIGERLGGEAGAKKLAEAVAAYEPTLRVYTEADMPADWAVTQNNLGNTLTIMGARVGGEVGAKMLSAAITALEAALTVYTQADMPFDWARAQNNLGIALARLGARLGGEAGAKYLARARTAFESALTVYTETDMPIDWAMTQENLGVTRDALARLSQG